MAYPLLPTKILLPILLLVVLLPVTGHSQQAGATATIRQATSAFYQSFQEQRAAGNKLTTQQLRKLVDTFFIPHADFRAMAALVLGRYWRQASELQRKRFVSAFRELLISTYAANAQQTGPENIRYLPERKSSRPDRAIVRTIVKKTGEPDLPIDYYMVRKAGAWKVYDVHIDGISLVSNYRSSFASEIARLGLDAFIGELEKKVRQGGTARPAEIS